MPLITRAPLIREQVVRLLREEIAERRTVGDMLPGEPALAAQLKVSRNTVRAAYAVLERQGLIERKHGMGTVIVSKTVRAARAGQIGLVFFSSGEMMFREPFYTRIIGTLFALGRERGWNIALMPHDVRYRQHRYDWREHEHRLGSFQAMLLLGVFRPGAIEALARRLPVVAVDAGGPFANADSVVCDDIRAGLLATEHLLHMGHQRIAFLGQIAHGHDAIADPAHVARYEGYRLAMRKAGLDVTDDLLLDTQTSGQGAATALRGAIERGDMPSAVVGTGDVQAMAAMAAARRAGLRIPEDLSVVGIGNNEAHGAAANLTSVELHPEQMAEQAARLLALRIAERAAPAEHCLVEVELIERGSSAPPGPLVR
jgi:DNA-binding LacI/PurR family transcriptional regulator